MNMIAIFSLFWRMCTFRAGPDQVPANTALTVLIVAVNLLLNIGVQLGLGTNEPTLLRASNLAVVSLAGTAALVWLVMTLMNHGRRFPQTITAIMGTDLIMTALTATAIASSGALNQSLAMFVLTLVTLWTLAVFGFIFHRALEIHIAFGIAMAFFVVIFSVAITQSAIAT